MIDPNKPTERDELSGVETTGHEWDGLKELNLPAPRWWLMVFLVTVVWSVGYWVVYPAWPTLSGHTKGSAGWTQYKKLEAERGEILERRGALEQKIHHARLNEIEKDPELYGYAVAAGKSMFKENCAACHGTGAAGGNGYPNLNDDDWLWGGDVESIYTTLQFGIRSPHENTRSSQMPAFGEMLSKEEIASLADYVSSINYSADEEGEGKALFTQYCSSCHGIDGKGKREFGAPNLADPIWLYGGSKAAIALQIAKPRMGVMPHWDNRLSDATLKQLAVYVHSLGGGEPALKTEAATAPEAETNSEPSAPATAGAE